MQIDTSTIGINTIKTASAKLNATCFPNPANDEVTLQIQTLFSSDIVFTMTDIYGKVVAQQTITDVKKGTVLHKFSVQENASGIYFITLQQQHEFIGLKIVKR